MQPHDILETKNITSTYLFIHKSKEKITLTGTKQFLGG